MSRRGLTQAGRPSGRAAVLGGLILACSLFATPKELQAQTWTGANSQLWSDTGNWTPGTVPNSNTASAIITNATNNPVLLNGGYTIANLTIGGSNSLDIQNGQSLTIYADPGVGNSTINNAKTITLDSAGSSTDLILSGPGGGTIDLTGGGTLQLSNNGNNRIYGNPGGETFHIATGSTVQGSGQFGINQGGYAFTLNNDGTINANQSNALLVAPTGTVTNNSLLEATAGGTMNLIANVTNTTGTIKADGANSLVNLGGSTINGGTLTTTNGGSVQNNGTATFNGVTLSSGSTLTLADSSATTLQGTITNGGTIAQNSAVSNTDVLLSGAVELKGGTLAMSNNFNNRIYNNTGVAASLTVDANTTIQGAGQLGINNGGYAFTLTNNGTVLANQSNMLEVAPTGNTTNNGTFQANSGSTLFMNGTLTNYNPSTSTLTGGTYNAYSGTIALSDANLDNPSVIRTNAATILLDGATAKIADAHSNDIVGGFLATNTVAGHFTIQNGANLTTSGGGFTNAGRVDVGANSTFTVGGSNDYVQTGGLTVLQTTTSFMAVALGHKVDIQGGTLQGIGTVQGDLTNSGTVHPGGSPGILTVTGNYVQTASGILGIDIAGPLAGSGYSQLNVGGTAMLNGTLNVTLESSFSPTDGETFTILNSSGLLGSVFTTFLGQSQNGVTFTIDYNNLVTNGVVLTAHTLRAVPEPGSLALVALGAIGLAAYGRRRSKAAG